MLPGFVGDDLGNRYNLSQQCRQIFLEVCKPLLIPFFQVSL